MNPTTEPSQLQPPQPPQPHRPSTSCDRHPDEHFTGFCPSCLCERLAVLEPSSSSASSSRKPPIPTTSTATAALKAIFKPSGGTGSSKPSFFPELRRTKSFSASKNEGFSGVFEPQRKSCDVRVRSTLSSLFYQDDERNTSKRDSFKGPEIEFESRISSSSVRGPVFESKEEDEIETDTDNESGVLDEPILTARNSNANPIEEIIQEEEAIVIEPEKKWRQKQKLKKRRNGGPGSATLPVEKPIGRQYRETQSEIADYGFGRRSCDTDPRFSLDAGRISFDDPRYSFDEPRASWDGYLIGRTFPRMPTMVSVVEDAPVNVVLRDYYSDSSSRRRRSFDRSNSIRKTAAAVVAEIDELKHEHASASASAANAKVSPATVDYFHAPKLVVPDRDSNSNSLRDDCSETFEMGFRDHASIVGNGERKGAKKSRRWSKAWNIWGFIHRRSVNKDEDEDMYSRANGVERSFSESWQELREERNGEVRGAFNPKIWRSNSSVSWRNSNGLGGGSFGSARKSSVETNGHGRKKRDEFVLERNRSARYSPNNIDNGLLRFYLTPMRSSRRGGWGKNKSTHAQSIARSVLRLY
ncbi:hypothetical protein GH714_016825 [Hevea brasiliensis]|uniref:DUF740 family protein n=1 Tax=Hevea brasiliensis TaxID=3981 RepID=A0A6A6LY03_HEVBR|nr:hypothetical protein GH714_016825 [Hevea brasiliensis]